MNGLVLQLKDITITRQQQPLFTDFSYALHAGEALILKGHNGCGKSTLLKAIAGLLAVERGVIRVAGEVCYIGHQPALKDALTVRENIELDPRLVGVTTEQLLAVLAEWRLWPLRDRLAKTLSAGQLRRINLAKLQLLGAGVWLLDEPLTALDPGAVAQFSALLRGHLHRGGAAVVTTHQDLGLGGDGVKTLEMGV